MATIPAGSFVSGGFADAGEFYYGSASGGTRYTEPPSAPNPGNLGAFARTSDGNVAITAGNVSPFAATGVGLYKGSDLTVLSVYAGTRFGSNCVAADGSGYYYILTFDDGDPSILWFTKLDSTSAEVDTWDIPNPTGYGFLATSAMAVSEDGLTAYCWLPAVPPNGSKYYIHQFDLSGAGSYVGLLTTDYNASPGVQSLLCVPDGSGDVLVAFDSLNGGDGSLRRYTSTGTVVWTAGTPSGANAADLDWEGLALGKTGNGDFLAWAYDDGAATSSEARYAWFDYATGTPAVTFTPDDAGFEFDSQIVVLDMAIVGAAATTPETTLVNSTPCCGDTVTPGTGPAVGPKLPPVTPFTPECTGGGAVESAADLTDSEDWDSTTIGRQADVWFEMRLAKFPATDGTTVYRWSKRPLANTGKWVEGRLISCGEASRKCSDIDGNYAVGSLTVVVDDSDGMIRTLLEQETNTEYFLNREAGLYLLSPAGRAADLDPRVLFRGWISNVQTLKGRQVRIEVSDIVGSQFSGFNLDKTIGSVLLDDIASGDLIDALKGKALPIYAGELSDHGVLDVNGNNAERGIVPGFDIGPIDITDVDGAPPTPTIATPPVITASSVTGTTGQETRYYGATLITPYGESLMSNIVSLNGASIRNLSNYNEISGTFDVGDGSNKVRIWYGPSADNMIGWLDEANYDTPGTFGYFDGAAAWPTATRDEIDVLKPMSPTATGANVNPNDWNIIAICLGKKYDVKMEFGTDFADGDGPTRVAIDPALHGVEIITPDDPEWPYPNPWIERNGITFTGVLARGNLLKAHQDGVITFAFNICGPHDDDGLLINQAFRQLLWFLNEHVAKNGGTGYRTGDYWPLEEYANGDSLFQTTKFEDAQDLTKTWLGDDVGYVGMIWITEPITVREFVRRFCQTFGCRLAHNHHGQIFPFFVTESADPTLGRALREHIEIADIGEPELAHDEIMNRVVYNYNFDPDANEYRNPGIPAEDLTSIAAHTPGGVVGGTDRRGVKQGDDRELAYTNDEATAEDVITRELARRARRPRYLPVTVDLLGLEQDISAQVRATHREGLGSGGDVLMPSLVLEHTTNADTLEVTLKLQDLRTMAATVDFLVSSDTGDYLVASDGSGVLVASA